MTEQLKFNKMAIIFILILILVVAFLLVSNHSPLISYFSDFSTHTADILPDIEPICGSIGCKW